MEKHDHLFPLKQVIHANLQMCEKELMNLVSIKIKKCADQNLQMNRQLSKTFFSLKIRITRLFILYHTCQHDTLNKKIINDLLNEKNSELNLTSLRTFLNKYFSFQNSQHFLSNSYGNESSLIDIPRIHVFHPQKILLNFFLLHKKPSKITNVIIKKKFLKICAYPYYTLKLNYKFVNSEFTNTNPYSSFTFKVSKLLFLWPKSFFLPQFDLKNIIASLQAIVSHLNPSYLDSIHDFLYDIFLIGNMGIVTSQIFSLQNIFSLKFERIKNGITIQFGEAFFNDDNKIKVIFQSDRIYFLSCNLLPTIPSPGQQISLEIHRKNLSFFYHIVSLSNFVSHDFLNSLNISTILTSIRDRIHFYKLSKVWSIISSSLFIKKEYSNIICNIKRESITNSRIEYLYGKNVIFDITLSSGRDIYINVLLNYIMNDIFPHTSFKVDFDDIWKIDSLVLERVTILSLSSSYSKFSTNFSPLSLKNIFGISNIKYHSSYSSSTFIDVNMNSKPTVSLIAERPNSTKYQFCITSDPNVLYSFYISNTIQRFTDPLESIGLRLIRQEVVYSILHEIQNNMSSFDTCIYGNSLKVRYTNLGNILIDISDTGIWSIEIPFQNSGFFKYTKAKFTGFGFSANFAISICSFLKDFSAFQRAVLDTFPHFLSYILLDFSFFSILRDKGHHSFFICLSKIKSIQRNPGRCIYAECFDFTLPQFKCSLGSKSILQSIFSNIRPSIGYTLNLIPLIARMNSILFDFNIFQNAWTKPPLIWTLYPAAIGAQYLIIFHQKITFNVNMLGGNNFMVIIPKIRNHQLMKMVLKDKGIIENGKGYDGNIMNESIRFSKISFDELVRLKERIDKFYSNVVFVKSTMASVKANVDNENSSITQHEDIICSELRLNSGQLKINLTADNLTYTFTPNSNLGEKLFQLMKSKEESGASVKEVINFAIEYSNTEKLSQLS